MKWNAVFNDKSAKVVGADELRIESGVLMFWADELVVAYGPSVWGSVKPVVEVPMKSIAT